MRNSRASLFLMELMISILFFSLSSAVCIQLFVKAHTINEKTEDKSNAILIAQDISEYFHHADGDKEQILSYYTEYEETADVSTVIEEKVEQLTTDEDDENEKKNPQWWLFLTLGLVVGGTLGFGIPWYINDKKQRKEDDLRL